MTPTFTLSTGSYSVFKFPSGEVQVTLDLTNSSLLEVYASNSSITITGSILSSDNLVELLQLVEAIRYENPLIELTLIMPYCAYSRQDRRCNEGESFSLKVFTTLINFCNFTSVVTYDNHSDVSTALIHNCYNVQVKDIIPDTLIDYDYLISPDAGSNKKVQACSQKLHIPMLRADKLRDTATGKVTETLIYATSAQLDNTTVLIIDDICQGGRTFLELAKAIKAISPTCKIHLFVTHGFFSAGLADLSTYIDHFITTDSVCTIESQNIIRIKL